MSNNRASTKLFPTFQRFGVGQTPRPAASVGDA